MELPKHSLGDSNVHLELRLPGLGLYGGIQRGRDMRHLGCCGSQSLLKDLFLNLCLGHLISLQSRYHAINSENFIAGKALGEQIILR